MKTAFLWKIQIISSTRDLKETSKILPRIFVLFYLLLPRIRNITWQKILYSKFYIIIGFLSNRIFDALFFDPL